MKAKKDKLQEKVIAISSKIYEEAAKANQSADNNTEEATTSGDNVKEAKYEEK